MDEKQKLVDLQAEKKQIIENMRAANDNDDQTAFDEAQKKLTALDAEISRAQAIVKAEESAVSIPQNPENAVDCSRAFCQAIRAGASGDLISFAENRAVVNAGLTEGKPEEGGLLVPVDIQTRINELRRSLNPLANYFRVETVTAPSGSRVIDVSPTKGFTKTSENATIPQDDKPLFRQIKYSVDKYTLCVPVSEELLEDSDENITAYLARWMAKKSVITENQLLLGLLAELDATAKTATSGKELATIKEVLNAELDPAISLTGAFLTNQDGFNYLDALEDKTGRPLMQPDPTNGTRKMLLARPVYVVGNAVLPSATGGAPLYIGDFEQYGTLFRRKGLSVDVTKEGGSAWSTGGVEVRGMMRLGATVYDDEAAAAVLLAKATA